MGMTCSPSSMPSRPISAIVGGAGVLYSLLGVRSPASRPAPSEIR